MAPSFEVEGKGCWSMKTKGALASHIYRPIQQYNWSFILHQAHYNYQNTTFTLWEESYLKTPDEKMYFIYNEWFMYNLWKWWE